MIQRALALFGAAALVSGCNGCGQSPTTGDAAPATSASAPIPTGPARRVVVDLVRALPGCDIAHRGLLIDAGTDALTGRLGWRWTPSTGLGSTEHDGSTWTRVFDRSIDVTFTLTEASQVFVSARAVGILARSAAVTLDDQPLGTLALTREQIRIASTGPTNLPLDAGMHTVSLRFPGRGRSNGDPYADLDWIRIGLPDEDTSTYGAPTPRDIEAKAAALGGVPHRSLALRAPGAVRCPLRVPKNGRLRVAVGLQGAGEGEAELRWLSDGAKPEVLQHVRVSGGDRAAWTDVDLPVGAAERGLGALELRAVAAPRGARVLFGDPAITLGTVPPPDAAAPPSVRAVVIVVLDGVERGDLPPYNTAAARTLPALSELVLTGTTFERHRAPTTVVSAVVASLLTGLPPRAHGLVDTGARLPAAQTTIASIARDASVRTAMFTGVPTTFRPFGFGQAWERFVELPPNGAPPATAPLDGAAAWIAEVTREAPDARLLAVVHARGGHPPWDVGSKELAAIPPPDYAGMIEPRRAAQVLGRARQRQRAVLGATDRDRVHALTALALVGQDRALGALIGALKTAGLWDNTLFMVTGDVASGATEPALFGDGLDLRESWLTLPLYVHFPGSAHGGARVDEPTEIYDLARTSMGALGLTLQKEAMGRDLAGVAAGEEDAVGAPQVATLGGTFAARWGELVLSGRIDSPPMLCDLAVDPTCAFNRRERMPLSTEGIFRRAVVMDLATRAPPERREPATIDAETGAVLSVWGATE